MTAMARHVRRAAAHNGARNLCTLETRTRMLYDIGEYAQLFLDVLSGLIVDCRLGDITNAAALRQEPAIDASQWPARSEAAR